MLPVAIHLTAVGTYPRKSYALEELLRHSSSLWKGQDRPDVRDVLVGRFEYDEYVGYVDTRVLPPARREYHMYRERKGLWGIALIACHSNKLL